MSLKNTKDIEKLFKMTFSQARINDNQAKRISLLEEQARHYKLENEWLKEQMKTGLADVIMRVVQDEVDVSVTDKTDDEKLAELMKK